MELLNAKGNEVKHELNFRDAMTVLFLEPLPSEGSLASNPC